MNIKITGLKIDDALKGYTANEEQPDGKGGKEPEKRKRKKVLGGASNPATGTQSGNGSGIGGE